MSHGLLAALHEEPMKWEIELASFIKKELNQLLADFNTRKNH